LLPQILGMFVRTTHGIKYKILTCDTSNDNIKIFKSIVWSYRLCIEAFKHLRPVITIDVGFLSDRYKGILLMTYGYDVENKLFSLTLRIMDKENTKN
jgi:hypothetical protein